MRALSPPRLLRACETLWLRPAPCFLQAPPRSQHNTRARSRRGINGGLSLSPLKGRDRHTRPSVRSPTPPGPARRRSRHSTSEFGTEGAHRAAPRLISTHLQTEGRGRRRRRRPTPLTFKISSPSKPSFRRHSSTCQLKHADANAHLLSPLPAVLPKARAGPSSFRDSPTVDITGI